MKEQLKSIDERAKEELSHIDDAKSKISWQKGRDNFHT